LVSSKCSKDSIFVLPLASVNEKQVLSFSAVIISSFDH
jgi:hypothetical protein